MTKGDNINLAEENNIIGYNVLNNKHEQRRTSLLKSPKRNSLEFLDMRAIEEINTILKNKFKKVENDNEIILSINILPFSKVKKNF